MQLYLFHGRKTPDEHLQDWGFDGPTINEITSLTGTYGKCMFTLKMSNTFIKHKSKRGGIYLEILHWL